MTGNHGVSKRINLGKDRLSGASCLRNSRSGQKLLPRENAVDESPAPRRSHEFYYRRDQRHLRAFIDTFYHVRDILQFRKFYSLLL